MAANYDLWDTDTGNNLGHFLTEEAAIERVRLLLAAYGDAYADDLVLASTDADGKPLPSLAGTALAQWARQPRPALRGA